jgi:hypothetical protein
MSLWYDELIANTKAALDSLKSQVEMDIETYLERGDLNVLESPVSLKLSRLGMHENGREQWEEKSLKRPASTWDIEIECRFSPHHELGEGS